MSISRALPNQPSSFVFSDQKHSTPIHVKLFKDTPSKAIFIQVIGERLILESFRGHYEDQLKEIFSKHTFQPRNEFNDLKEIFGNAEARKNYFNQKAQSDDKVQERIEFNAQRAINGNPFTGFTVIEKTTDKIIGFVSIGSGSQKGEAQSALILNPSYTHQGYGFETALLAGSLAHVFFLNSFGAGPSKSKAPFEKLTATCIDANTPVVEFIKKLGFEKIRPLNQQENYSYASRSLYGINANDLKRELSCFIDLEKLTWEVIQT